MLNSHSLHRKALLSLPIPRTLSEMLSCFAKPLLQLGGGVSSSSLYLDVHSHQHKERSCQAHGQQTPPSHSLFASTPGKSQPTVCPCFSSPYPSSVGQKMLFPSHLICPFITKTSHWLPSDPGGIAHHCPEDRVCTT